MNHTKRRWLAGLAGGLLLAGCQSTPQAAYAPDYSQYDPALSPARQARNTAPSASYGATDADDGTDPADISPAAGPADQDPRLLPPQTQSRPAARRAQPMSSPADDGTMAASPRSGAMAADLMKMQERLERVERAMLRLDRRMQLVERNELNRMGGDAPTATSTPRTAFNLDDNSNVAPAAGDQMPAALTASAGPAYQDGFQPVSTAITSALQAAPAPSRNVAEPQLADRGVTSLPSLADSSSSGGTGVKQPGDLAIWTIKYDSDKVWPERDQLPASRDVVSLLREKHAVTLFARGSKPNSVEFRERVKAISRYLAKVTSLDSVPIAALAAPHLDEETIEIFAAP